LNLQSVLASALDAIRPSAESKAIRVENKVDGVCPIYGDPMRLQQAFWNLLSNAIKFTPQGGRVTVATEENGEEICTKITDTGMGINKEALPHVFERFWQADSSRAKAHGGLGLGLAIAQSIVQNHGGTIEATSSGPGEGATFVVRLHRQRSHLL
jgi:signal transduction histidine kinase